MCNDINWERWNAEDASNLVYEYHREKIFEIKKKIYQEAVNGRFSVYIEERLPEAIIESLRLSEFLVDELTRTSPPSVYITWKQLK